MLGSNCFGLGEYEEAVSAYRAFLEAAGPDSAFLPTIRVLLAVCLESAGHAAEAKAARTV